MTDYIDCFINTAASFFKLVYHPQRGVYKFILPELKDFRNDRIIYESLSLPWEGLAEDIFRYFCGEKVLFDYPIDYSSYTVFQKNVLKVVKRIPYGETLSYGGVAEKAGFPGSQRAVGNVMSINRCPIFIPCHRVIKGNGEIGGFSRGLEWKDYLLKIERQ